MRTETRLFVLLSVFFVVMTTIYGLWTGFSEPIGVTALALTAGLFILTGFYLGVTGRQLPARPDDNPDAEIAEAEGDYGYFIARSWSPLWLGASAALMFAGLAIGWWLFIIGAFFGTVATVLWVFESFSGEYSV
jgi:hypothetical protein